MKKLFRFTPILLMAAMIVSCKKDNYDPPSLFLTGHIMYQGEAIQVERSQVPYQMYQYGLGKVGQVGSNSATNNTTPTTFSQEGAYSQVLFAGTYKLIIPNGQGPFIGKLLASGDPDSLVINLSGNQTADIEVTPYYMIRTPQITGGGGKVSAVFKAEKIITDANAKDIESVGLYVNKTQFVSSGDNIRNAITNGSDITDPNNIALTLDVPAISPAQNYVYARVGIKIAGVEDRIYSPAVKVNY